MIKVAPSILSGDFAALGKDVEFMQACGADYIHCDVMDGMFVQNITFGPGMVKALKKHAKIPLDVHLMIEAPERYVKDFADAGSDIITVHAEASIHLQRTLSHIRSLGCKAGLSFNPASDIGCLEYVLNDVDLVLVMSVNPGFGGQSFINSSLDKISRIKALRELNGLDFEIEVDGGINGETAKEVIAAGANVIVAGSYLFSGNAEEKMIQIKGQKG